MNATLTKVKQRGYWEVVIRPVEFAQSLIEPISECKKIIHECCVRIGGWEYPVIDLREASTGTDYIEHDFDIGHFLEFWRYYQSGQFYHCFVMTEDWREYVKSSTVEPIMPGEALSITRTIYTFTRIYEFASRLASKGLLGEKCKISVTLHKTDKRTLLPDFGRRLFGQYKCKLESVPRDITTPTQDLIARSAELALDHTAWVFQRFNWDHISPKALKEDQRQLLERGAWG